MKIKIQGGILCSVVKSPLKISLILSRSLILMISASSSWPVYDRGKKSLGTTGSEDSSSEAWFTAHSTSRCIGNELASLMPTLTLRPPHTPPPPPLLPCSRFNPLCSFPYGSSSTQKASASVYITVSDKHAFIKGGPGRSLSNSLSTSLHVISQIRRHIVFVCGWVCKVDYKHSLFPMYEGHSPYRTKCRSYVHS